MGVALKYGPKVAEMLPLIAEQKYIGALKKIEPIAKGIKALTKQLNKIVALQNMPTIFTKFMNPLLLGLKIDLAGQEKFTQTEGKIKETKEALKKMGEDEVKLTAEYATAKSKIMMKVPPNKDIKEMQKIINLPPFVPVKTGLRKSLPSALLLFLIEDKETPKTNAALAKFTVEKIKAAKKKVEDAVNKATGTTPAPTTTTPAPTTAPTTTPAPTTAPTTEKPKTQFGKRKRGPSASLKRMCKKHGVRLTVKRGKKRVYKSSKVLKEQCKNKLKNKLKKNFGRKKIKRSSIMPPKRKRRGKKRSRLSSAARGARKRASAAARYARKNPGASALGGALGLGALGLGGYEAYSKYKRSRGDDSYYSPTGRAFTRAKGGVMGTYDYFTKSSREQIKKDIMGLPPAAKRKVIDAAEAAKENVASRTGIFDRFFPNTQGAENRRTAKLFTELPGEGSFYGKRRRRRRRFGDGHEKKCSGYGKRRRRRRKSKYDFGKKAKKPSAATRRMCKKLKVRMTLKRGGKRVYKSEAMLKKQCKKAMKRKSKK